MHVVQSHLGEVVAVTALIIFFLQDGLRRWGPPQFLCCLCNLVHCIINHHSCIILLVPQRPMARPGQMMTLLRVRNLHLHGPDHVVDDTEQKEEGGKGHTAV